MASGCLQRRSEPLHAQGAVQARGIGDVDDLHVGDLPFVQEGTRAPELKRAGVSRPEVTRACSGKLPGRGEDIVLVERRGRQHTVAGAVVEGCDRRVLEHPEDQRELLEGLPVTAHWFGAHQTLAAEGQERGELGGDLGVRALALKPAQEGLG